MSVLIIQFFIDKLNIRSILNNSCVLPHLKYKDNNEKQSDNTGKLEY